MSNYSLPLFMQVKENAVQDLNKNLSLYMPKLIHTKTLILTTDGLLQTLEKKVVVLLKQLMDFEIITVQESSFDFAVDVAKKVAMNNISLIIGLGGGTALDTAKYAAFVANVAYIARYRLHLAMTALLLLFPYCLQKTAANILLLLKFLTDY